MNLPKNLKKISARREENLNINGNVTPKKTLLLVLPLCFLFFSFSALAWLDTNWKSRAFVNSSLSQEQIQPNISVLNPHSHPPLGGNWTVRFNTTGTADLNITLVNRTTWGKSSEDMSLYDLKFRRAKDEFYWS